MNLGITGSKGEDFAVKYLRRKKYRIIARNYQTRFGEIDIICTYGQFIAFVEVKTRSVNYMVSGKEAVTHQKQKKIIKAAMEFLQRNDFDLQPRFDVIEVISDGGKMSADHIENAFDTEGVNGFF